MAHTNIISINYENKNVIFIFLCVKKIMLLLNLKWLVYWRMIKCRETLTLE